MIQPPRERHTEPPQLIPPRFGLVKSLTRQGDWLFRYRGQAPIPILLVIIAIGLALGPRPWGRFQTEPWEALGLLMALWGILIRAVAIGSVAPGTSGGNTEKQIAESLNTTGIYSVVRHPLYLGNLLMWIGVGAYAGGWPCALIATLAFGLLYERIMIAEEHFLHAKFGMAYSAWAEVTPLVIPRLSRWTPPLHPFSVRRVLRREYSSLLSLLAAVIIIEVAQNIRWGYGAVPDPAWALLPSLGLIACLAVRTAKKRSTWLDLGDATGANR